eukprot:CAMPEP_0175626138 /NCGR_PEP_ID=MMETSP0096-20121207/70826_1 /TAXON_ID=311494 /ORGANISM="Alexandrium monilatum, Strain CCMP3105" /LENGTH=38 /DNA_ID= /DNA_START= /DNA_END= /DNA_ORIENTATION=
MENVPTPASQAFRGLSGRERSAGERLDERAFVDVASVE